MSDSLWPYGLWPARLLYPRDSPGKNTGVGCHLFLSGIFLTQGSNLHPLHWHSDSLLLSYLLIWYLFIFFSELSVSVFGLFCNQIVCFLIVEFQSSWIFWMKGALKKKLKLFSGYSKPLLIHYKTTTIILLVFSHTDNRKIK